MLAEGHGIGQDPVLRVARLTRVGHRVLARNVVAADQVSELELRREDSRGHVIATVVGEDRAVKAWRGRVDRDVPATGSAGLDLAVPETGRVPRWRALEGSGGRDRGRLSAGIR